MKEKELTFFKLKHNLNTRPYVYTCHILLIHIFILLVNLQVLNDWLHIRAINHTHIALASKIPNPTLIAIFGSLVFAMYFTKSFLRS